VGRSERLGAVEIDVTKADHNGIRVFQANLSGVCCGTLIFGVGSADELPALAGITHLLEHLLLRLLEPIAVELSAVVDAHSLKVFASGSPDEVGQFFSDFVASIPRLRELTDRDLKFEKRIVRIENPNGFDRPTAGLLTYRYGLQGAGRSNFGAPATIGITKQDVVDWATRWLRVENTTFAISTDLPPTLDLRLPWGPVTRAMQSRQLLKTPALVASANGGVALSLLVGRDDAGALQEAVQLELFLELRHRRGQIYTVDAFTTAIDDKLTELVFVLDPERRHIGSTVRVAVRTIENLVAGGFSDAAVTSARIHGLAHANRTFAGLDYLDRLAEDSLHERPTRTSQERADAANALNSERLTAALADAGPSLIVAYDEDVALSQKSLVQIGIAVTRFTAWQPVSDADGSFAETAAASWWSKKSKTTVTVTDEALMEVGRKSSRRILFNDIVLAGDRSCGCFTLVDFWGRSIEFDADHWKRLKSLKKTVLAKLDPSVVRQFPKH
jgi:predicted Zn-dependent peptidase